MPKTWKEKMNPEAKPKIVRLVKKYAGVPEGAKLFIATPEIVRNYIAAIPKGKTKTMQQMRAELAKKHKADATCPTSSGIFVRIAAEAALDEMREGTPVSKITPFWRIVDPDGPTAEKLSCGPRFIKQRLKEEA